MSLDIITDNIYFSTTPYWKEILGKLMMLVLRKYVCDNSLALKKFYSYIFWVFSTCDTFHKKIFSVWYFSLENVLIWIFCTCFTYFFSILFFSGEPKALCTCAYNATNVANIFWVNLVVPLRRYPIWYGTSVLIVYPSVEPSICV